MQEAKQKKEAEEPRRSQTENRRKMNKAVFHLLTCAQEAVSIARSFYDGTDRDNDSDSPPCAGGAIVAIVSVLLVNHDVPSDSGDEATMAVAALLAPRQTARCDMSCSGDYGRRLLALLASEAPV